MKHTGPVGVIGAGSWVTTLAHLLAAKGLETNLWVFEEDLCETIRRTRENTVYLPGFRLHDNVHAHSSLEKAGRLPGEAGQAQ